MIRRMFLLSACVSFANLGLAQCDDALACNYDPSSEGTAGCNYFQTQNFALSESDFFGFYEFDGCDNGITGWDDFSVNLVDANDGGPLELVVSDAAAIELILTGFDSTYAELTSAEISVCGDTMHYVSVTEGQIDLAWNGLGFDNPLIGGYFAPESSYPSGCANPDACNFVPCASPADTTGCDLLQPGTIIGDSLVTSGTEYTYTYEGGQPGSTYVFYTACGTVPADEQGGDNVVTFVFDFPSDCELCVQENQPTCSLITCLTLIPEETSLVPAMDSKWTIAPNPARNVIQVDYQGESSVWTLFDLSGREMMEASIAPGQNAINVERLPQGVYLFGPRLGPKTKIQIVD